MKKMFMIGAMAFMLAACGSDEVKEPSTPVTTAMTHLKNLTSVADGGFGPRAVGTELERLGADHLQQMIEQLGFTVERTEFTYTRQSKEYTSQNLAFEIAGKTADVIVLGAHYDSTGYAAGSEGAGDSASGVAALMEVAETIKNQKLALQHTVRFVFFGAEEHGKRGSIAYVLDHDLSNVVMYGNFDTIASGDYQYISSPHPDNKTFACADPEKLNADTKIRDLFLTIGEKTGFKMHAGYDDYPAGTVGNWSDHYPFACAGIPIVSIEATNFEIDGQYGFDGYSQTTKPELWTCFDPENMTACDRKSEKLWGKIWHTGFDRVDVLEEHFPGRLADQMDKTVKLTLEFLKNPKI